MIKNKKIKIMTLTLAMAMTMSLAGCKDKKAGMVALVDGEGITIEEFEAIYNQQKEGIVAQLGEDILKQDAGEGKTIGDTIVDGILDQLEIRKLIEKDAKKRKIEVEEKEVEEQMKSVKESVGGEEKYKEALKTNGLTEEEFKQNMESSLLMNKYQEAVMKELKVTDDEAKKHLEKNKEEFVQIKASHILLKDEAKAKEVLEKIKKGEDFAKLAEKESEDTNSAKEGGNLGYFAKGAMIPEFENAAFKLKKGEVSGIVKSEAGFHIIKLDEKKEAFKDLKEEVIQKLKSDKYTKHIEELKKNAEIEVIEENVKSVTEKKDDKKDEKKDEKKDDKKEDKK